MLSRGGDVTGTVKRSHWFHCTHDQQLRNNDKNMLIEKRGSPTSYSSTATIEMRTLTVRACRTGTKNVSLTMSTVFNGLVHDCVLDGRK